MSLGQWFLNSDAKQYAWGNTEKYIRDSFKQLITTDAYCQQLYETLPAVMNEDIKTVTTEIDQALNNKAGLEVPAALLPALRKHIEEYSLSRWYLQLSDTDKEYFALNSMNSNLKDVNSSMLRVAGISTVFSHILRDMLIEYYQKEKTPEFTESVKNRIQQYTVACMMANNYQLVRMHAEQKGGEPTALELENAKQNIHQKKEFARKLVTGDYS
jgi:hypothetical protein